MLSIKVHYSQAEVKHTWLNLSVQARESYLTFSDPGLITTINCLNTSLFLTTKNNEVMDMKILEGNYPLLDAMDIYWGEQCKLQMNKGLLKGRRLIELVAELWPDFLVGEKVLYFDMKLLMGIFDLERINSWKAFQIAICKLIEQSLLMAQFNSLKIEAERTAMKILNPKIKRSRKKKKRTLVTQQEAEKVEELVRETLGEYEKVLKIESVNQLEGILEVDLAEDFGKEQYKLYERNTDKVFEKSSQTKIGIQSVIESERVSDQLLFTESYKVALKEVISEPINLYFDQSAHTSTSSSDKEPVSEPCKVSDQESDKESGSESERESIHLFGEKAGVFYDMDSFLIDISSETSTQASTELEPDPEKFFFDEKLSSSRSYELRKKYSKIEIEWDEEMLDILYLSQYEGNYLKDLYQIPNLPEIPVVVNYYNNKPYVFYLDPEDMNSCSLNPYNIIQRYI